MINTRTVWILFAGALLLAGCTERRSEPAETSGGADVVSESAPAELANLGPAPEWRLNDLAGRPVNLSDFAGKVVIIDFWATYCPPCIEEIPNYVALQREYGEQGLVIVGISADRQGPFHVLNFVHRLKVNYPIVMLDESTAEAYAVEGLPAAFVVDRNGDVRYHKVGYGTKEAMERVIRQLL